MKLSNLKIISGGQTGVDRGALEAASMMEALGLRAWGGWAPKGFKAEDGEIPEPYRSKMRMSSGGYKERTVMNVQAAHGTVVVYTKAHHIVKKGGTHMTLLRAWEEGRAVLPLFVEPGDYETSVPCLTAWFQHLYAVNLFSVQARMQPFEGLVEGEDAVIVNFAGPRESKAPGIQDLTCSIVGEALDLLEGP